MGVVPTNKNYTYNVLMQNIDSLKKEYSFLEIGNIGKSVLKKDIPFIKIGNGNKNVLYHGAIHANEWITSVVLMKFIEEYSNAYKLSKKIYGYDANKIFNSTSIYIVPMVNPDGVDLVTENLALKNAPHILGHYIQLSKSYPNIPFPSGWKANFNGVDLKIYQPIFKAL